MNKMEILATDRPFIEAGANAEASVELEDLSRFEGEGGHEAPIPEWVDVPLYSAIWRRPRWAAQQTNEGK